MGQDDGTSFTSFNNKLKISLLIICVFMLKNSEAIQICLVVVRSKNIARKAMNKTSSKIKIEGMYQRNLTH